MSASSFTAGGGWIPERQKSHTIADQPEIRFANFRFGQYFFSCRLSAYTNLAKPERPSRERGALPLGRDARGRERTGQVPLKSVSHPCLRA